uniref:Ubiquitin carboxyl-terminal hydrolase n=1 Tax=Echinococcus granulosus TaxID=6210 RepID=A0A068WEB1_ECHGR|nr:ubiquitin carboxyl terminal hydrolase 4 [Echinococcus granulosus]
MGKMDDCFHNIGEQQRKYDEYFYDGDIPKLEAVDDERCVIISKDWFDKWKTYIRRSRTESDNKADITGKGDPPGPLDISSITSDGKLKINLALRVDVMCIPEALFEKLTNWYGFEGDERAIPYRKVYVTNDKEPSFDLYPPFLHLRPRREHKELDLECDSKETIGYVKNYIRNKNGLKSDVDIHLFDAKNGDKLPDDEKATLKECSLDGEKDIEYAVVSKSMANGNGLHGLYSYKNFDSSYPLGVCGLSNLGNTCFMNSAIQCIASVAPLRSYVIANHFEDHINSENKLGSGGNIARAFACLMRQMWSECNRGGTCVPRELKIQIAKIAPQFAGYQQQDAQELMNFLLDFLHEDLNKVKQKPPIEAKDADRRPDKVLAEEAWSNFKKRNDSIIVDLFYGLLKSTVTCPECKLVSITFDPFNSLSLPLTNVDVVVRFWPSKKYLLPVVPSCRAKDILTSFERHLPHQDRCEYVVTTVYGNHLKVIPLTSEESLRFEEVCIFNLTKSSYVQIFLHVDGEAELPPFLANLRISQRRFTKKDLILAVKVELSSISAKYGEMFERFANLEKLKFSPDSEVFDLNDESCILIGLPESLGIELNGSPARLDIKLDDCIDLFLASEQLGDQDLWYCKKCQQHRQAFKKFDIWSLPQVLVIHLKRYRSVYRMVKNKAFVDYPETNLKVTCVEGTKVYDLVAVSNHMGFVGGGHYTAYAKNGKTWYSFNDSFVDVLRSSVVTGDAYILVYMLSSISTSPETINGY